MMIRTVGQTRAQCLQLLQRRRPHACIEQREIRKGDDYRAGAAENSVLHRSSRGNNGVCSSDPICFFLALALMLSDRCRSKFLQRPTRLPMLILLASLLR